MEIQASHEDLSNLQKHKENILQCIIFNNNNKFDMIKGGEEWGGMFDRNTKTGHTDM